MQNITITTSPAPSFPAALRSPSNGDMGNTATFQEMVERIAQALGHIKGAINGESVAVTLANLTVTALSATATALTMSGTSRIMLGTRSITRVQSGIPTTDDPTTWTLASGGAYMEQIANAPDYASFELRPPNGSTLTSVIAYVVGGAGHSSLPTGSDRVQLEISYVSTGGSTIGLWTQADTATLPTYENAHTIVATGSAHVVDRTANRYFARIKGEQGGNYAPGYHAISVACVYTPAYYDED